MPIESQEQADILMQSTKIFRDNSPIIVPPQHSSLTRELITQGTRDVLLLDINRKTISVRKYTVNERFQNDILVRLDIGDTLIHPNPPGIVVQDGRCHFIEGEEFETIHGHHIHVYVHGYGDRIAFPLNQIYDQGNNFDVPQMVLFFFNYCHIINLPTLEEQHVF